MIAALLKNEFNQLELHELIEKAKEEVIEQLFDEIYERLGLAERNLLTTASLFSFPFLKDEVINASMFLFNSEDGQASFTRLKRQLLIQETGNLSYKVHEVIQTLALTYSKEKYKQSLTRLADFLSAQMQPYELIQLEVILLYHRAGEFDKSAEVALSAIQQGLIPYHPALAEILLDSFQEGKVSSGIWVWLVGCKGLLASFYDRQEEAKNYYKNMLSIAIEIDSKPAIAIAFQRLGVVYSTRDFSQAERYYFDSLAIQKQLDDIEAQAEIYCNLGSLYIGQKQWIKAQINIEKSITLLNSINAPDWRKLSSYDNLATLFAGKREWEKANEFRETVIRIAEQEQLPQELARSLYNLGVDENRQGLQNQARSKYFSALEIAQKHNLYDIQELAYNALGKQSVELEDYHSSIEYFQKLLEIHEKAGNTKKLIVVNFWMGFVFDLTNDLPQRNKSYQTAVQLSDGLKTEQEFCLILSSISSLSLNSSLPRLAIRGLRFFRRHLSFTKSYYRLAKVYESTGEIYIEVLGIVRPSTICMFKAASLFAKLNCKEEQVGTLVNFASSFEVSEDYGLALETNTEAIRLAEAKQLNKLTCIAYYNRANCFTKLEMWKEAEQDFNQSIIISEFITNGAELKEAAIHNLGEMYRRLGQFQDAIRLLSSTLEASRRREDIDSEIMTLNNLGLTYQEIENYEEALNCFNTTLVRCQQEYRKSEESNVLMSLGNYYLLQGQLNEAKQYYNNALTVARSVEDIDAEEKSILCLAYAHQKTNTFNTIAEDFKNVAERAGELGNYESLVKFLTFCGEISFNSGELADSCEMFSKALIAAYLLALTQAEKCFGVDVRPKVIARNLIEVSNPICDSLKSALASGHLDDAKTFQEALVRLLQEHGEAGEWLIQYCVEPINKNLNRLLDGKSEQHSSSFS